ncbi:hypothetical protein RND81_03G103200 [Saponaria officinalis]|uniref:Fe2OG dioxygenase domain-containing protein n=1 Tax=Saponaria officinalis TaxID=3572 RepID=A0AAW1M6U1_SAPOF
MYLERVQALVHEGLHELPPQFIRPLNERPLNSQAVKGLINPPLISLSQPRDMVVKEISAAAKEWGFFAIKDHGVPASLIQQLQNVGQEFFALPQNEKEKYANDPSKGKFEGYGTKLTRNPDDKLEWIDYFFHIMAPSSKIDYEIWPRDPPLYREVTEEYNKEIQRITDEILGHLSEGLGLEEKTLKTKLGDELEVEMKINMYPPCPQPELALGVEAHTDMSALTILLPNHVPGLQIWKDDTWVAVDYLQDALYIHIGDQIEVLSNGKYKSILHRSVVNKDETRMSWAVFCVPPSDTVIGPLPELVNDHNPANYSTKTYAQFRYNKINKLPQ